jgi:DNA polymerase
MVRRALQAQIDLGLPEVVVNAERLAQFAAKAKEAETSRVVSVGQAIASAPQPVQPSLEIMQPPAFDSLDSHRAAICECQLCPLGQSRNKFVYGVGDPSADLMFVGEAPGAKEDELGEPFVGRAGKLLDDILKAMKLTRQEIYIANILKCRPPGNRDPQPEEMTRCMPYLREQIRIIRPKLLCALGRIAAQGLLQTTRPLGKLRGEWHNYEGVPMLVTYHPAALLRFPQYKRDTWTDMQLVMARLEEMKKQQA